MIDVIIFSKDRPCQLDALLRSLQVKMKVKYKCSILFKSSHSSFTKGYDQLFKHTSAPLFLTHEIDFKDDFLNILKEVKSEQLMFLVDDIIFKQDILYDDIFKEFEFNKNILALSLRLGKNITYCYTRHKSTIPPKFKGMFNTWIWKDASNGYWDYPMSVDGTIFRTGEIISLIRRIKFGGPNILENELSKKPLPAPLMICYDKSKLVNLALNKVHNFPNRCGKISQEFLNRLWLSGQRICLDPIYSMEHNACHAEVELLFEDIQ